MGKLRRSTGSGQTTCSQYRKVFLSAVFAQLTDTFLYQPKEKRTACKAIRQLYHIILCSNYCIDSASQETCDSPADVLCRPSTANSGIDGTSAVSPFLIRGCLALRKNTFESRASIKAISFFSYYHRVVSLSIAFQDFIVFHNFLLLCSPLFSHNHSKLKLIAPVVSGRAMNN